VEFITATSWSSWCSLSVLNPAGLDNLAFLDELTLDRGLTLTYDRYGHLFPKDHDREELDEAADALVLG
jgi:hypothetical protein